MGKSYKNLLLSTFAFMVCFAAWTINGVLITFLVDNGVYKWDSSQTGLLLGAPILTGALLRLPMGTLSDRYGGKYILGAILLLSAVPIYFLSFADNYTSFLLLGLGYGISGSSFAAGVAYTSVWFPQNKQGTVLGIFGGGTLGAALTTFIAPTLLKNFTEGGSNLDNWRRLPEYYAIGLIIMGIIFLVFANNKRAAQEPRSLIQLLSPLKQIRVWRFGLYYFLVFGSFVALSQWLIGYYLNVYSTSLITAGLLATLFSFPAAIIRAAGGLISDKFGARKVLYWVFGLSCVCSFLLIFPRMEVYTPGSGISAVKSGTVSFVSDTLIIIDEQKYNLKIAGNQTHVEADQQETKDLDNKTFIFPTKQTWTQPVVKAGDKVDKRQIIAKGVTRVYFQANMWVFTGIIFVIAILWGIGSAAVYKHIPTYFPKEVGVVGGMVGVLGALGGFFLPIVFGFLLELTGLWTTMWILLVALSAVCLTWMHNVISKMMKQEVPDLIRKIEHH